MIKKLTLLLAAAAMFATADGVRASEPEAVTPNYTLAEQFSPMRMRRLVPQTSVEPNWFKDSNKFWYSWNSVNDINYYIVDPASGKQREMWSMAKLAE
jgi:hypothetical protein